MRSPWLLFTASLNIFIKAAGVRSALSVGYRRRLSALSAGRPARHPGVNWFCLLLWFVSSCTAYFLLRSQWETCLRMSSVCRLYLIGLLNCRREAPLSAVWCFVYSVDFHTHVRHHNVKFLETWWRFQLCLVENNFENKIRCVYQTKSERYSHPEQLPEIPLDDRIPPVRGDVRILPLIFSTREREREMDRRGSEVLLQRTSWIKALF